VELFRKADAMGAMSRNSNRHRHPAIGAVVFALALSPLAAIAHAQGAKAIDHDVIAEQIMKGTRAERVHALTQAKQIAPQERSSVLRSALAQELMRVNSLVTRSLSTKNDVTKQEAADLREDYYGLLIEANADADDPVAMPALIGALGTGNMAIRAAVRYGKASLAMLISLLADPNGNPGQRSSAARCVGLLLSSATLDRADALAASQTAVVVLSRPEWSVVINSVMDMAVLTGDQVVVKLIERIATDPSVIRLVDNDPDALKRVQDRAKRALDRRQR
jgi:hypothetical protein